MLLIHVHVDVILISLFLSDPTDVVQVVINDHTDPDPNNNCNSFNTSGFQVQNTKRMVDDHLVCSPYHTLL